jgi:hypothetical protein
MITRKIDDLSKLDNKIMYMPVYSEITKKNQEKYYPLDRPPGYIEADCLPDRFAFSSPELMGIYACRYDELDDLVKRTGKLFAENSICQHLKYHNVKIKFLESMYYIQR